MNSRSIDRPAGLIFGSYTATATNIVCGSTGITCAMRVRAVNIVGAGPWSDPLSGTTWRAPSAVDLTVTGGNQSITASWSAPTDIGDFPLLDYRIGGFRISAVNQIGPGSPSNVLSVGP